MNKKIGEINMDNKVGSFCKIFGVNPRNKILELFLEVRELDFSIGDIAKETGMNRATTYNTMEELTKESFIIPSRKVSGSQLYKLNLNNEEVKILTKIFDNLLKNITKNYSKKNN